MDRLRMAAIQGCHVVTSLDHRNVIVTMCADAALKGRRPGEGQCLDYVSDDKYNYNPKLQEKDTSSKGDAEEPRKPIVEICLINADKDSVPGGFQVVVDMETLEPATVLQGTGNRYYLCYRRGLKHTNERPLTDIRIKSCHTKGFERESGIGASSLEDNGEKRESHTLEYNMITKTYDGERIKSASDEFNSRFFLWTKYGSSPLMDIYTIENRNKKSLIANHFLTCVEVTGEGHLADLNQGSNEPRFLCLQNDLTPYRFSSEDLDKIVNLKYVTPLLIALHQRSAVLARGSIMHLRDLLLLKFLRFTDIDMFCYVLNHISRAICEAINMCEKPEVIYASPRKRPDDVRESDIGSISGVKRTCQQLMAEELLLVLSQMYIKYHSVETIWGFLLTSTRLMEKKSRDHFLRKFTELSFRYSTHSLKVHRYAVYEEKWSSDSNIKKHGVLESPIDLDEASSIQVLKKNASIILNSVDIYHPRVRDAVKTICDKLFPKATLRVVWPIVCTLFFLAKCADVPYRNLSSEMEGNSKVKQTKSLLNLSHDVLNKLLENLLRSDRLLGIKSLQLVLRIIFPRLIARNFLNHNEKERVWAQWGLEYSRIIISRIKKIKPLENEVLVLMDQMILPHLEEPGVLLSRRFRILTWLSNLFESVPWLPAMLFHSGDICRSLPLMQRIFYAVSRIALDSEEFVSDSTPLEVANSENFKIKKDEAKGISETALKLINHILRGLSRTLKKRKERRLSRDEVDKLQNWLSAKLEESERKKDAEKEAWKLLLENNEKGCNKYLDFLLKAGFASKEPEAVVNWLLRNQYILPEEQLGSFLGGTRKKTEKPEEETIRLKFFQGVVLPYGMNFEELIKDALLTGFRLPGEGQKIDRILWSLSEVLYSREPEKFDSVDGVFALAYALVMLHTFLHNPKVKENERTKLPQWLGMAKDLEGIHRGFSPLDFERMYRYIRDEEWIVPGIGQWQEEMKTSGFLDEGRPSMMNESEVVYKRIAAQRRATSQNHLLLSLKPKGEEELPELNAWEVVEVMRALLTKVWCNIEIVVKGIMKNLKQRTTREVCISILSAALMISLRAKDQRLIESCQALSIDFWKEVLRGKNAVLKRDPVLEALKEIQHTTDKNMKKMCRLAERLREMMTKQFTGWKDEEKMEELQEQFGQEYQILKNGRVYVADGDVFKVSRDGKETRYTLFLFNDILLYAGLLRETQQFKIEKVFPLCVCNLAEVDSVTFELQSPIKNVKFRVANQHAKKKYRMQIEEQIRKARVEAWTVIQTAMNNDPKNKGHSYATTAAFIGRFKENMIEEEFDDQKTRGDKGRNRQRTKIVADFQERKRVRVFSLTKQKSTVYSVYDLSGSSKGSSLQDNEGSHCHLCLAPFPKSTIRIVKTGRRYFCKMCMKHCCKSCFSVDKTTCKVCLDIDPILEHIKREGTRTHSRRKKNRRKKRENHRELEKNLKKVWINKGHIENRKRAVGKEVYFRRAGTDRNHYPRSRAVRY